LKNALLKIAIRCLKPFIPKSGPTNKILVVATTALGDTLWITPSLHSLRKSFPNAQIHVLTSPIGLQILQHNPHVDKLLLFKKPLSLWRKLLKERFETVLIFHTSQRLVLPICSLLGASKVVGTVGINKGLDALLTDPIPKTHEHEIVRRLKIAHAIGAATATETLSFFLQPEELLPPRSPGLWIALHPGSKDAFKRWPYFAELGRLLKKTISCEILITGGPEEQALMEEIAKQIPGAHLDSPNQPFRQFAALIQQMDLVISNDTGPVHLACALDRPVIGIYASTDPTLCGPHLAKRAIAISKKAPCTPCLKRKCRLPFCFLQIGPEEVARSAKELLRG